MVEERDLTPREVARKNLESGLYQNVHAANGYEFARSSDKRGSDQWLKGAYDDVTGHEEFSKQREKVYTSEKARFKRDGIYGEPSMPTNADIAGDMVRTIQRSLEQTTLGDLYDIAKTVDSSIGEYKLPEAGKEYSIADLIEKAQKQGALSEEGRLNMDIFDDKEKEAFVALNDLKELYKDACSEKLRSNRRKSSLKNMSEARHREFHPEPETPTA